eukprot:CAMPEP_0174260118 /NCGR_PEP_ID=MMETSP0439-20130205/8856_1 /TAXON_ID=0 /ORGANISM="Stereomyxa ramosa, Strain Chinc5" /LENGTH=216 /DNA_ID=CAMNT_0015344289 /DNA_START=337 /DNA_END=987 /DNA_ORIENTATION=-
MEKLQIKIEPNPPWEPTHYVPIKLLPSYLTSESVAAAKRALRLTTLMKENAPQDVIDSFLSEAQHLVESDIASENNPKQNKEQVPTEEDKQETQHCDDGDADKETNPQRNKTRSRKKNYNKVPMSKACKRTAVAKWKGEIKQAKRRIAQLNEKLSEIEKMEKNQRVKKQKLSRQQRVELGKADEYESELKWQMTELANLTKLTKEEAIETFTSGGL